jgi:hypothetical protein
MMECYNLMLFVYVDDDYDAFDIDGFDNDDDFLLIPKLPSILMY